MSTKMNMKIKRAFYLFVAVLCLAGCAKRDVDNMVMQEIKLDDAHNIGVTKDPNTPPYKISQCEGLLIDRNDFNIPQELNPKNEKPNAIHFIKSNNKCYYRAEWKESGQILLSKKTLVPINKSPSFKKFKTGEEYAFVIGRDNFEENGIEKLVINAMWMGTINVTSQ